jgi:hypothetical protein
MYRKACSLQIVFRDALGASGQSIQLDAPSHFGDCKPDVQSNPANHMKIKTVQKLYASLFAGYLLLHKHVTYCCHSNIIAFTQVVQQVT